MTAENAMIVMFTAVLLWGDFPVGGEAGWAPTDAASLVSY